MAFIEDVKAILSEEDGLMVKTKDGKIVPVQAGITGEIIVIDNKEKLSSMIWGKERIGVSDLEKLDKLVMEIIVYVAKSSSAPTAAKIKKKYPSLFK